MMGYNEKRRLAVKLRAVHATKSASTTWWASLIAIIVVIVLEKWLSYTSESNWKIIVTGIIGSLIAYVLAWAKHYLATGDWMPPIPTNGEHNATDHHSGHAA